MVETTTLTITEGLAEIKTIMARLVKKREAILQYVTRHEGVKDPHESIGGSTAYIARERQAIGDMERRIVAIRTGVQRVNLATVMEIEGTSKTVAEWLTWRKEVAKDAGQFLNLIGRRLQEKRTEARQKGFTVVNVGSAPAAPSDLLINVDEAQLIAEAERLTTILGMLDGRLSHINATTTLTIAQ